MKSRLFILLFPLLFISAGKPAYQIALLKYGGGGDWYANPTALPNLIAFCNEQLKTNISPEYATVDVGSSEIFNYPFVHMTGHGNVVLDEVEITNLRRYLLAGGFLHIDDNYGLREFVEPQMKKVFPELDFEELPASHPVFRQKFSFPNGLPKIHEHDNKPPQALGLIHEGRLICLFTYESDLSDGWEDADVHNDPADVRLKALQMGANIVQYVFSN